ncbi:hypothetical protein Hanom_Chr13g01241491 [Helianthus anomalus]
MTPVRVVDALCVEGRRSRGRPKFTWDERIKQYLIELHLIFLRTWSRIRVHGDVESMLRIFRRMLYMCIYSTMFVFCDW